MMALALPDGRRGQILAVLLTLLAVMVLSLCTAAPLISWYQARADRLAQEQMLAARMADLSREIAALRRAIGTAGLQADNRQVLLPGATDVIAGANLQSALQGMASGAGTALDSAALLPTQPSGGLRRISLQVSVTTTWPVLIALLQAISTARPYLIVNQISLAHTLQAEPSSEPPLLANFTVSGFRTGTP